MKSLKNKAEFDFVYKNGKKCYAEGFNLYVLNLSLLGEQTFGGKRFSYKEKKILHSLIESRGSFFLGLSVSKKIGNAPMRNKIKRRFRAFCRNYQERLEKFALIVVAKNAEFLDYSLIQKECKRFLFQGK